MTIVSRSFAQRRTTPKNNSAFARGVQLAVAAGGIWAAMLGATRAAEDAARNDKPPLDLWSVVFSPDGRFLAAGAGDERTVGRLTLWDLATGKPRWIRDEPSGIANVSYSPDGKTIAACGCDRVARLFNAADGEELAKFADRLKDVGSASFSPDGKLLATAGPGKLVTLWDIEMGSKRFSLEGHDDAVLSVAFSPDGRQIASAGRDGKTLLSEVESRQIVRAFEGNAAWVQQAVFSPDGEWLATASADNTARVWQIATGRFCCMLKNAQSPYIRSVTFVPNSKKLAVVGRNAAVQFYDVILPDNVVEDSAANAAVVKRLNDDDFQVREAASRELAERGFSAFEELSAGAAASNPREMRIRCQRLLDRLQKPRAEPRVPDYDMMMWFLAISPDGKLRATGSRGGAIKLWDVVRDKPLKSLSIRTGQ